MSRVRWFGGLIGVLLAAGAMSAADAQAQKGSVGALRLASSGAIFIAQDKGYFAAEGLDTEL
jgi:ABC-type nitrate/sulfonate/bicarbonate transport system substrate-binding protein